jgi:hypothetical protein
VKRFVAFLVETGHELMPDRLWHLRKECMAMGESGSGMAENEEVGRSQRRGPSWEGYALRVDALLRGRFPNLVTRIFEIAADQYSIVFDRALQDANLVADEFANTIRVISLNAQLSNEVPKSS